MTKRSPSRRTGIADVAKHAGVSHATVSRVMNGNFSVDPGIAARVRLAAEQLKYQPNSVGRSLALGRTDTIGVVVPDLANPTFQAMLKGVTKAAARDGYRVLIADSSETPSEESILASEARRRCDGVILCAPRMTDAELQDMAAVLQPMVLINRTTPIEDTPSLSADYGRGISDLAAHLVEQGHRSMVFLAGPERSASNRLREEGLRAFLAAAADVELVTLPGGVTFAEGHGAVDAILATGATGVLAFNDLVAMGLLSGLHERGIDVPGEISVTGFDDIPFARYTTPPLTTSSVPITDLGELAWQRMGALLAGSDDVTPATVIQPTLTVRSSSGPAPRGRTPSATDAQGDGVVAGR